ncbi:MAG: hypothetical protein EBV64_14370 [Oxalobacteraceae bacterium]|jgi:hypothetical protein|nr:hypothetical protein [Oxalobacteraceae bacterium]
MPIVRVVTKPARSVSAVRGAVLALLVVTVPAAAYNYPRDRKDLNTYRATYKCRYDGFRKFGSVVRFTADGDERPVYFKIDRGWKLDAKQRLFKKSYKSEELTVSGKTFPPRFVNAIFVIDDLKLVREHGFVDSPVDYIAYYNCAEID